jgi:hypothetical protein
MKSKYVLLTGLLVLVLAFNTAKADNPPEINITLTRYDPYPAQPGSYLDVWVETDNLGLGDASNLTVEVVPSYPFSIEPGVSASRSVTTLGSLNNVVFQYKVRVDENAVNGINELKIRYQIAGTGGMWITQPYAVFILGKNKLEVSDVSTTILEPGKSTPVVFTLSNVGSSPIRDLSFSWKQSDDLILPVGSDNRKYINSIDIGDHTEVVFTMTTSPDTSPGVYPVTITMSYASGNSTPTQTSEIGFIVGGTTDFDVSAQGSSGQVSLSIANIGANNANSVTVEIPDQPSFSATGGSSSILGNLNRGDYTTATFQISSRIQRNATAGGFGQIANQSLLIRISYTDTTGLRQSVEKQVSIPSGTFSSSSSTTTFTRSQSNGQGLTYIIIGVAGIAAVVGFFIYRKRKKKK